MTDIFSKEKRSEIMSRIRSKNTKVEILVFRELGRKGLYFQKHYRRAVGNPDIALPRKKKAVFIDGDFWHGYGFKKTKDRLPEFWITKIEGNIKRDRKNRRILKKEGWGILRIWEHEIEGNFEKSIDKIVSFLED